MPTAKDYRPRRGWAGVPIDQCNIVSKDGILNLQPASQNNFLREPLNDAQMTEFKARLSAMWVKHKSLTGLCSANSVAAEPGVVIALAVELLRILEDTRALDPSLIMTSLEHPTKMFHKVKTRLHVALLNVTETDVQLNEDTMPDQWKVLVLKLVSAPPP